MVLDTFVLLDSMKRLVFHQPEFKGRSFTHTADLKTVSTT